MGRKKGRMTVSTTEGNFPRKWMSSDLHRNLDFYVKEARVGAYNHNLIAKRRSEMQKRTSMQYPYLGFLLSERVRSDARNRVDQDNNQLFYVSPADKEQRRVATSREYFQTLHFYPFHQVPSLQSLTIQKIAKSLRLYDIQDIDIVLHHLASSSLALFNYYAASYDTFSASIFRILAKFPLEALYITHSIPDRAITEYLRTLQDNVFASHKTQEHWEDIDYASLEVTDRSIYVKSATFYLGERSLSRVHELISSCPCLTSLTLINTNLAIHNEIKSFDESLYAQNPLIATSCFQFLQMITGFPDRDLSITLVCCSWLSYEDFSDFFHMQVQPHGVVGRSVTITIVYWIDLKDSRVMMEQEEIRRKWLRLCKEYNECRENLKVEIIFQTG